MGELLYPYLVAVAATVLVLTASWFAYIRHQRAAFDHQQKAMRIPDFVRYMHLKQEVEALSKERDGHVAAIQSAQLLVEQAAQAKQWLDDNRSVLEEVKQQVEAKNKVEQDLVAAQDQLAEARSEVAAAQDQLLKARTDAAEAEAQLKVHRAQQDGVRADVQKKEGELKQIQADIQERSEKVANLEERIRELSAKAAEVADRLGHEQRLLDAASKDLKESKEQLASLRDELLRLESARDKCRADMAAEEARKAALLAEQAGLKRDVEDLAARLSKAADAVRQREESLQQLQQRIDERRSAEAELKTAVAGLEAKKVGLERDCADLKAEQASLKSDVEQLGVNKVALEGAVRDLERKAPPGILDSSDQLAEIFKPVIPAGDWKVAPMDKEANALERFGEHLKERKIHFHPRVQLAFHTALKSQADSPLLVLAGISGTGKSLLPQLYAEAMGINTLIVPVQPRWDGPQDLLGFYHHLEGRFKPTDLTRALLQFDPHVMEQFESDKARREELAVQRGENGDLSDRMLLVLLDEMNLARVEYYFSEFLSRLETRRDVDLGDPAQRSKAALQLELGGSGEGRRAVEMSVGRNVLFVGTINEDESTQTLSDKVVDRANMMRFGCPRRLARPEAKGEMEGHRADAWLSASAWQRWLDARPLHEDQVELVEKTTGALKDLMGLVGRPFGHRTSKAIHAYVQHYPGRTDVRVKNALADQVEQRILPKLRGIDPNDDAAREALEALTDIVRKNLGDEELADAIESARQHHAFHWQGLDRKD